MSQALYRKWRPQTWEAVIGQEHVIQTLRNAIGAGRVAHAYLFSGPRGTGKTTTARLLAKAVNCLVEDPSHRPCGKCEHCESVNQGRFLDLIEIDAASNTSVEDVRDLRDKINFSPNQGQYKVYIIDEVHMLSTAAFNALLKTLEEPPSHAIFILATTEVHKIPATVLSRCQRHEFRRISVNEIVDHLQKLAEGEAIQVDTEALKLVARQSTGAMRDAISLLDQLASSGQPITLVMAQDVLGAAASQAVIDIVDAVLAKDSRAGLDNIHAALDAGSDPRQFARQVVDYLRDLLLMRMGNADQVDATTEVRVQMARHTQGFTTPGLLRAIRIFNQAANEARGAWQPSLPLEMALVEAMETETPAAAETAAPQPQAAPAASRPASPARQTAPARAAPVPEPAPEEEPEEDSPADAGAAQRLNQSWPQILNQVRQRSPNTYGLLNSCKARHLKNGVLIIGFASDVLKFQMEKSANIEVVQQIVQQVLGSEVTVRCFTTTGKQATLPPNVDSDGMVAAALNDLGGEIVDIQ